MAAVQPTHIQWQFAQPGSGIDTSETHCSICHDDEVTSPILAHRITDAGEIGHRVHQTCLERATKTECPLCRRSYNRSELPASNQPELPASNQPELPASNQPELPASNQSELPARRIDIATELRARRIGPITDMLSEGKKLGIRIAINFSTYAIGGIFGCTLCFTPLIISRLIAGDISPVLGIWMGSVLGACMGATALSLVGDVSLYAGRRIIEWTHVQNPTLRKIFFVSTAAFAAIASTYVAMLLYSVIETHIIAQLAPQAQAAYSYLMGNADRCSGVSHAMWNTAVLTCDRMCGVILGSIAAFLTAILVKQALVYSEANLDETIAV